MGEKPLPLSEDFSMPRSGQNLSIPRLKSGILAILDWTTTIWRRWFLRAAELNLFDEALLARQAIGFSKPFSLLREPVYMQIIEPQINTVFQGLWGIVFWKGKNSPPLLRRSLSWAIARGLGHACTCLL